MGLKSSIMKLLGNDNEKNEEQSNISEISKLSEINDTVSRIYKIQKEMSINIEDIQTNLYENSKDQSDVVNTIISVIDYIDDFYIFASSDKSSPLFNQAQMMLNGALKRASAIGLTRIHDDNTQFDSNINTIEASESNSYLPDGFISKTLKSGYLYNGETIRKSKVVVIKN